MINLKVLTSTNRPTSKGRSVAVWIVETAVKTNEFHVELLDLAEINLPFMDEPHHPRMQNYMHEHTKKWSKSIDSGEAFIIVLGEYNYGFPAPIKNAIDYLHNEWKHKPLAFVSYGGVSAGLRSTQMLKQVVTTMNMMPIQEQVNLPFFANDMDENGVFRPNESAVRSAESMLKALKKWSIVMKPLRTKD